MHLVSSSSSSVRHCAFDGVLVALAFGLAFDLPFGFGIIGGSTSDVATVRLINYIHMPVDRKSILMYSQSEMISKR